MLKAKTGKSYTSYKNKYCPKAKHSAFGDFPAEYMPKKQPVFDSQPEDSGKSTMSTSMRSKILTVIINPRNVKERHGYWRKGVYFTAQERTRKA